MRFCELTRGWRPSPLAGRTAAGGVGEQVVGPGDQLAGDRGGGDLLAAAAGGGLVAGGEVRVPLGGLRGLAQHPPGPGGALLGDVPVVDRAVAAAHGRGEPGPGRELAGGAEATAPMPTTITPNLPLAGSIIIAAVFRPIDDGTTSFAPPFFFVAIASPILPLPIIVESNSSSGARASPAVQMGPEEPHDQCNDS